MNSKILKLAESLMSNEDCVNQEFTLTLNLENVIKHKYIQQMVNLKLFIID